jgi:hypothetical protein
MRSSISRKPLAEGIFSAFSENGPGVVSVLGGRFAAANSLDRKRAVTIVPINNVKQRNGASRNIGKLA